MLSLKVNYNYWYRILSATILSTVLHIFLLKSAVIHFYQRIFFKRISEHQSRWNQLLIETAVFSEQHQLYWN